MVTVLSCDREECVCNENWLCRCDWGIRIDSCGECMEFEEREEDGSNNN